MLEVGAGAAGPEVELPGERTAQEEEDERICRVCFCGEEAGRLFVPCRCRGSMKYVHPHCLNEWRATSVNARSYTHCDQCGYRTLFYVEPIFTQEECTFKCSAAFRKNFTSLASYTDFANFTGISEHLADETFCGKAWWPGLAA